MNLNVQVRTSFSRFPKFNFNIIFCNFGKVRNRTNSKFSVNLECSETPVFDPKPAVFASKTRCFCLKNRIFWLKNRKLFPNYFRKNFASSKSPDISKKFPNFDNRTIPKLTKTKSSENSVFRRALGFWMTAKAINWCAMNCLVVLPGRTTNRGN